MTSFGDHSNKIANQAAHTLQPEHHTMPVITFITLDCFLFTLLIATTGQLRAKHNNAADNPEPCELKGYEGRGFTSQTGLWGAQPHGLPCMCWACAWEHSPLLHSFHNKTQDWIPFPNKLCFIFCMFSYVETFLKSLCNYKMECSTAVVIVTYFYTK